MRLVDDLLDVSRITTGMLRLNPEVLTLNDVIGAALETSRHNLDRARVVFTTDLPADPVPLHGDRVRLAQVFSNLLDNAAKYTDPGGRVSLAAAAAGERVEVRVRDTGVGFPPEVVPQIFELFTQVDRTLNRTHGSGLGVGLALVRQLVEMHKGTIGAESGGPGAGAEFRVELPLYDAEMQST